MTNSENRPSFMMLNTDATKSMVPGALSYAERQAVDQCKSAHVIPEGDKLRAFRTLVASPAEQARPAALAMSKLAVTQPGEGVLDVLAEIYLQALNLSVLDKFQLIVRSGSDTHDLRPLFEALNTMRGIFGGMVEDNVRIGGAYLVTRNGLAYVYPEDKEDGKVVYYKKPGEVRLWSVGVKRALEAARRDIPDLSQEVVRDVLQGLRD